MDYNTAIAETEKGKKIRLPGWSRDTTIKCKSTEPYLYRDNRFGKMLWSGSEEERNSEQWEVVED